MSSTNINFSVDEISQQNKAKKLKEGVNHQGAQKKCGSGVKQGCVTNAKNEPEKRAHTLDPFADSLLSPASRAIMKKFSCPEAAKQQEKKALGVYKKELPSRDEGVVRKRAERALLHGFDCRCCAKYYDTLELSPQSRKRRVDAVSRHRGVEQLPPTPPRYWDLQMPSTQEQHTLGWIQHTDSPLLKKQKIKDE
ncbi:hypothetical protein QR680_017074 [Steinernema hermaphroditum]|uniref:DNA endonuclease activator Ctp1 C-terminal domain-containing protein n=1 Tax=Steinernema hermaphroditum TaxID=289476 RepID=A0AA39LNG8_9BILA|nr:hypothetical protein QR680_017074 [Steinernema hermaphroditum]